MIRKKINRFVRCLFFIVLAIIICLIYIGQQLQKNTLLDGIPESANKFILFKQRETQFLDLKTLRGLINRYNEVEVIHNSREFGPVGNKPIILVIIVNKFSANLKYLIASLSNVKGIQDILVIFSHSFYDENINKLIEIIDFCRVLQIFYPYSLQLYPSVFPGFSSNYDTYRNVVGSSSGRNPENVEKKHHWWWTANKVFEDLSCIEGRNMNLVIFMNEDQYLLEDFLYMAIYMKKVADSLPQCNMISLAVSSHYAQSALTNDTYRLEFTTWEPKYHSEVIGFDFSTWNTIVSHFDLFCLIDDYSWSRSLQYISLNRLDGKRFKVISIVGPRSFRTSCGSRRGVTDCGVNEGIYKALSVQKRWGDNLFPPFLEIYTNIELLDDDFIKVDVMENNGGWNDMFDKELCNNMTIPKVKKILLDMQIQFSAYN